MVLQSQSDEERSALTSKAAVALVADKVMQLRCSYTLKGVCTHFRYIRNTKKKCEGKVRVSYNRR